MRQDAGKLRFADFQFDSATGELRLNGRVVPLEHQPSRVLARLVASPGQLVTREELAAELWGPGTHVNFDEGLNYCVRQVRAALGDDAKMPQFIATLPRRGYRFIAPVSHEAPRWSRPGRWAVGLAAALAIAVAVESVPNNSHHEMVVALATSLHDLIY